MKYYLLWEKKPWLVKLVHHDPSSHSREDKVMKPRASWARKHVNANSFVWMWKGAFNRKLSVGFYWKDRKKKILILPLTFTLWRIQSLLKNQEFVKMSGERSFPFTKGIHRAVPQHTETTVYRPHLPKQRATCSSFLSSESPWISQKKPVCDFKLQRSGASVRARAAWSRPWAGPTTELWEEVLV